MEEKLKYWSKRYKLKDLVICGYQGGYHMIQFKREEDMSVPQNMRLIKFCEALK